MGFLSPLFLLAGLAAAIPLILHLFQRQERRRVPFPALRYLQRTAREHARSIRVRQLLLLALRVAVILLVALAGARLYVRGEGGAHEPTALALVVDNSPSSGVVVDGRRVLDRLLDMAGATLDAAGEDDRIWVIRAGSPGDVSSPGGIAEARERLVGTEPGGAAADLRAALERAAALVRDAGLPRAEIHLLSDLQRSTLPGDERLGLPPGIPVIAFRDGDDPPANVGVTEVEVGGGLAPLAGQRTEVVARIDGAGEAPVSVRLVVGDRVVAATEAPPGGVAVMEAGPFPGGWVEGHVEIDPDAFRGDDRRSFAFQVRPPPRVATTGPPSAFGDQALQVLAAGGRVLPVEDPAEAQVWVALEAEGIERRPQGVPALVIPPADPTLLPAVNRRLADAGVGWRLEPGAEGEARPGPSTIPVSLGDLRIRSAYRLVPPAEPGPLDAVLVPLASGEPWVVSATGERGPILLLASPLDPEASTLPVSAAMVPFLEWAVVRWAAREASPARPLPGLDLPFPTDADRVVEPDGTEYPRVGNQMAVTVRMPGVHRFMQGERLVSAVAANLDPAESDLERLTAAELRDRLGPGLDVAGDEGDWRRGIFPAGRGPEAWRPLLLLALALLLVESRIAATGRRRAGPSGGAESPLPSA